MSKKLVEIKSLYTVLKSENKTSYVMNDGNLVFNKGACVGIIGESGSGKTELLKTISGIQSMVPGIVKGSVTYYLNNGSEHSVYKKRNGQYFVSKEHQEIKRDLIGFIPQDPKSYLNPYWTIRNFFKESYKIKKRDVDFDQFIEEYLKKVDIDHNSYQYKFAHQLSGGEAQRVMVALVLSKEPSLIIADESTTGLDVSRQKKVIDTFKKIHKENSDLTMIFISHDLGFLSHVVNEYYVIYGGFICEHITSKNQFSNTKELHPYTRDLISKLMDDGYDSDMKTHDEVSFDLLSSPLTGCPYYNSRCTEKKCKNKSHFHNEVPPMFDDSGNSVDIDINKRWKRSDNVNGK